VTLLSYLAGQLLRGCQSADNQFQALQNQEIEGFLDVSLLGGFLFLFLGHLQTFLYFPIVLDFRTFLSVDIITLFTLVLLRH
jgi:hypothetical protein